MNFLEISFGVEPYYYRVLCLKIKTRTRSVSHVLHVSCRHDNAYSSTCTAFLFFAIQSTYIHKSDHA